MILVYGKEDIMTNNERINYSKISSPVINGSDKKKVDTNHITSNITMPYEKKIETEHVMEAVVTAEKLNVR